MRCRNGDRCKFKVPNKQICIHKTDTKGYIKRAWKIDILYVMINFELLYLWNSNFVFCSGYNSAPLGKSSGSYCTCTKIFNHYNRYINNALYRLTVLYVSPWPPFNHCVDIPWMHLIFIYCVNSSLFRKH